jgi:DNA-binding response OmpR family regulator
MRFLVVEDNPNVANLIQACLEEQAYIVDVALEGRKGEELAMQDSYDGIILDLMLPDHDGVEICRNLRRRGVKSPVLMLTALSETSNKVEGLNAGADDYLTKPFEMEELLARTRALLRRSSADQGTQLRFEGIEMNLLRRTVVRDGVPLDLTAKEFALLEQFLRNANRVMTRTLLGERVWELNFASDSNVIDVYVSRLRSKVDKPFDRQLLHTVTGMGYVLRAEEAAVA